jgi:hypothetical protein
MKKLFFILIAGFVLLMAHNFNGAYAGDHDGDGGHGIPLSKLAGKYSVTFQLGGFFTQCFKPDFSATESCSTPGAIPINISGATVGQSTQDSDGDSCAQFTGAFAVISGQTNPPSVLSFIGVSKVTSYDPATGSGDSSFTNYVGGKCIGAKFDSTGSTINSTGTNHFVASDDGDRVDGTTLTFTDALGDIGGFNIISSALKQHK